MKSNSTSRKRSKKYNPNKLTPAQVQANQRKAELLREAALEYEFSMRFVSKDIREFIENKNIEEAALLEGSQIVYQFHITSVSLHTIIRIWRLFKYSSMLMNVNNGMLSSLLRCLIEPICMKVQ